MTRAWSRSDQGAQDARLPSGRSQNPVECSQRARSVNRQREIAAVVCGQYLCMLQGPFHQRSGRERGEGQSQEILEEPCSDIRQETSSSRQIPADARHFGEDEIGNEQLI